MDNPRAASHLAQFVIDAGLVSAEAVHGIPERDPDGVRFAEALVKRGFVAAAKLAQVLSYQLCLPWVSLDHVRFSPKLIRMIPADVAVKFGVVPVHVRRRATDGRMTLYVATDDPTNPDALAACEKAAGLPVRMMVATPVDITTAIALEYGEGEVPAADDALADTAPDGSPIGAAATPPRNGLAVPPKPPPPPRSISPDTDVAAAAARMSSPDLSEYQPTPSLPFVAPDIRQPGSTLGPSASSPPPPRVASAPTNRSASADASPIPGLSPAAGRVAPRIVDADDPPATDDDIEEIDDVEFDDESRQSSPPSNGAPTEPELGGEPVELSSSAENSVPDETASVDAPSDAPSQVTAGRSETPLASLSDSSPALDDSQWEPSETPLPSFDVPPPPPPRYHPSDHLASAPPPPGLVPPPPPPPPGLVSSNPFEEETDIDFDLGEADVSRQMENALTPSPPAGKVRPAPSPEPGSVALPQKADGVALVVGADKNFVQRCQVASGQLAVRLVPCTLMRASTRVEELHPFVIMVPDAVFAFDRYAFMKLAFESGSPLLVWDRDLELEQVTSLLEVLYRKAARSTC